MIIVKQESAASIPTPPTGKDTLFIDIADGVLKKKDDTGAVTNIEPGTTTVTSVFGRTGAIVALLGDYDAAKITNVPAGDIVATNVQDAINELDAEKAPITHVGAGGISQHPIATGANAGFMSPSDFTKLGTVQSGATANQTDAYLLDRANHTGTQVASTISDFNASADARITAQKGNPNGLASLDSGGKVPLTQIPASLVGAVQYQGTWNANLNSPPLASGVGTKGFYYVVSVAGSTNLDGITDWKVGDWAIFDGSFWEKLDQTESVSSVNGYTGAVVLNKSDIGLSNVPNVDATLRSNQTGTQPASTITGLATVATSGAYADLSGTPANLPPSGAASGELSGTYPGPSLVNSAVIAKVLTGFAVDWNIVTASDSILTAIQKLAGRAAMSINTVSSDVTVPTNYTWLRQNRSVFSGTTKVTIQPGGKISFIG